MHEIQKFKNEIDDIVDDTVSYVIDIYEDTAERLKIAFDKLRESIGEKKLVDLKDKGG